MRNVYIRLEIFISVLKWLFPVLILSSILIGKAYGQCVEPTGLTESNITISSATVSWVQCQTLITIVCRIDN